MTDKELKTWEQTERAVVLTNDQWNKLVCYILMSTNYRKREREAWERLAAETKDDGTPRFKNAKANAEYYEELEIELEKIKNRIDER